MSILIVNDDGFGDGVVELINSIKELDIFKFSKIRCVVPLHNMSCSGAKVTIDRNLTATKCNSLIVDELYKVDGTPLDCLHFGLATEDAKLVLSGINIGPNWGTDWLYSGTVCAAIEASRLGNQAIAFSYCGDLESFNRHRVKISTAVGEALLHIVNSTAFEENAFRPQEIKLIHSVNIPNFDEISEYRGVSVCNDLTIRQREPSISIHHTTENETTFTIDNNIVQDGLYENQGDIFKVQQGYTTVSILMI